jgi:hypothetical protein
VRGPGEQHGGRRKTENAVDHERTRGAERINKETRFEAAGRGGAEAKHPEANGTTPLLVGYRQLKHRLLQKVEGTGENAGEDNHRSRQIETARHCENNQ